MVQGQASKCCSKSASVWWVVLGWLFGLPFLVNVHVMLDCLPNRSRVRWVLGYKKPEILSKLAIFLEKYTSLFIGNPILEGDPP